MNQRRSASSGFTLLEMMVVVIIITLMAGVSVAMLNVFMRGQSVRQAGNLVSQTFAQAKQHAAETRVMHFVKFENGPDGNGVMTFYRDTNLNKTLDAGDLPLDGRPVQLPKGVKFKKMPKSGYIGVEPSGYISGFVDVPSSLFEKHMRENEEDGDIILSALGQGNVVCIDVDPAAGKVRKATFLTGYKDEKK